MFVSIDGDTRSVSDVVAFVLTFSIIIVSIGTVSIVGVDNLTEFRDREQINSAERGMAALATSFEDIHRQGDRFRATELSLSGGAIRTQNDSRLRVRVDDPTGPTRTWTYAVGSLQHRLNMPFGETTISYEAGGVFSSRRASPLHEPALQCTNSPGETAIISVVNLTGGLFYAGASPGDLNIDPESVPDDAPVRDGEAAVDIFADLAVDDPNTGLVYSARTASTKTVSLNVSGMESRDVWQRYLDSETNWQSTPGEPFRFQCSAQTVVVRVSTIQLSG